MQFNEANASFWLKNERRVVGKKPAEAENERGRETEGRVREKKAERERKRIEKFHADED